MFATDDTDATEEAGHIFSRRMAVVLAGQSLIVGLLALRIGHLQIAESKKLQRLAEKNRFVLRPIVPRRSDILDRYGVPVATVRSSLSVSLIREPGEDASQTLARFVRIANITDRQLEAIQTFIRENPDVRVIPLFEDADRAVAAQLAVNAPGLLGMEMAQRWVRNYPGGTAFAHTVGYVGRIANSDIVADPSLAPLKSIPEFRVGKRGAERRADVQLRGRPGVQRVEVNAAGRILREIDREPPVSGDAVTLTLDAEMQNFAHRRFGEQTGACLVMDVHSGEILCMYSTPGFDPNKFARGLSKRDWEKLQNNPRRPLIHRAVTGEYAPGSTFKIVVALAARAASITDPSSKILCTGSTQLPEREFFCWKENGHGFIDFRGAIQQSCDTYFYHVAEALGPARIASMARRLGLGTAYDIGVSQAGGGFLPTESWMLRGQGPGMEQRRQFQYRYRPGLCARHPPAINRHDGTRCQRHHRGHAAVAANRRTAARARPSRN